MLFRSKSFALFHYTDYMKCSLFLFRGVLGFVVAFCIFGVAQYLLHYRVCIFEIALSHNCSYQKLLCSLYARAKERQHTRKERCRRFNLTKNHTGIRCFFVRSYLCSTKSVCEIWFYFGRNMTYYGLY